MRPAGLVHLYRMRLRARLMQELLAVAGIAVGVALVFVALVANTSLTGIVREQAAGIYGHANLQLAARGPEGLDARLVRQVSRLDGVAVAAPVVEVPANLIGPRGQRSALMIAGGPGASQLGPTLVRHFAALAEHTHLRALVLPSSLATALGVSLGESVRVQLGHRTVAVPVGAVLRESDVGMLADSPIALAPLRFVQQIGDRRGRVSRVFVRPAPGRDRQVEAGLRRLAAGHANVSRADHDVDVFAQASYPTTASASVFSVFSALVGFLFAFAAVLLTVQQRRRFVTDLRMAGHEPWVIVELLLFDALMLGAAGSLLGLLIGDQASRRLFGLVPGYLTYAFALGEHRIVTEQSIAIAASAGVAAACVAVFAPLWDVVTRPREVSGRRGDGFGPGRWTPFAGLAALALTGTLAAFAPRAAIPALAALTAALLLLLPTALRGAAAAFEALTRTLRSPVPTLAALELRSRSTRTRGIALAATAAIAVFATVAIGGANADLQRGLDASASQIDGNGDVWVTFPGASNAFATTPFHVSAATLARLRKLPGVARVGVYRGSFLDVGDHRAWVQAPPRSALAPIPPTQLRTGSYATTAARLRMHGWTVLSEAIAHTLGVGVGDRVTLPSPMPMRLRVAAISTNLGWPAGAIILNADDYARAWGTRAASALLLTTAPGASPTDVAREARAVLAPMPARVETRAQRIARHYAASREGLHRLHQIAIVVLASAMLAMATAMGGMIWQRRPALAALKVHGYPEGELWRALLLESGLLLGTGCLVGAAFGLGGQLLMNRALETIADFPVFYDTAVVAAVGNLLLVTVVAVAMIALPGWLAVRVRPTPGGAT